MQTPWYQDIEKTWVRRLLALEARWLHIGLMHRVHQCIVQVGPVAFNGHAPMHHLPWLHIQSPPIAGSQPPDVVAQGECLPLPDQSVSGCVAWHVHDWSAEPSGVLEEAIRIIEPGGDLMLMGFQGSSRLFFERSWCQKHRISLAHTAKMDDWLYDHSMLCLQATSFVFGDLKDLALDKSKAANAWGHLLLPSMGSVYFRVYRKAKRGMMPIKCGRAARVSA